MPSVIKQFSWCLQICRPYCTYRHKFNLIQMKSINCNVFTTYTCNCIPSKSAGNIPTGRNISRNAVEYTHCDTACTVELSSVAQALQVSCVNYSVQCLKVSNMNAIFSGWLNMYIVTTQTVTVNKSVNVPNGASNHIL